MQPDDDLEFLHRYLAAANPVFDDAAGPVDAGLLHAWARHTMLSGELDRSVFELALSGLTAITRTNPTIRSDTADEIMCRLLVAGLLAAGRDELCTFLTAHTPIGADEIAVADAGRLAALVAVAVDPSRPEWLVWHGAVTDLAASSNLAPGDEELCALLGSWLRLRRRTRDDVWRVAWRSVVDDGRLPRPALEAAARSIGPADA